jgi:hypothetical protein
MSANGSSKKVWWGVFFPGLTICECHIRRRKMSGHRRGVPWFLWPFWAIWRLVIVIIELTGRLVGAVLGLVLMIVGVVVSLTVIGAIVGIPLLIFGFLLILRSLF